MAKKKKLETPAWIKEGYDSPEDYAKAQGKTGKKKTGKTFKVKRCPKCNSDEVGVLLGKEEGKGTGDWECRDCGWKGKELKVEELSEEEFMKYLDEKDEKEAEK